MDLIITDEPNRLIHLVGRKPVNYTPQGQCHLWIEGSIAIEGEERPSLIGHPRQMWSKANYEGISEFIQPHDRKNLFSKTQPTIVMKYLHKIYRCMQEIYSYHNNTSNRGSTSVDHTRGIVSS